MTEAQLRQLLDNRGDPDARAILNDWRAQCGIREERLGIILDDADADGDADADADGDDADDADDAADAAADADDADADDADADADGDAVLRKTLNRWLTEEPQMRTGLMAIIVPGGSYYRRNVWLVGWAKRTNGDEWELAGAITVWVKPGVARIANGFDQLAAHGLGDRYAATPPAEVPEPIHRLLVRRCKPANADDFKLSCPMPAGWVGE